MPRAESRFTRSNFLPSGLRLVISKISSNIIGEAMINFKSRDNRLIVGVGLELDLFGRPDICDMGYG